MQMEAPSSGSVDATAITWALAEQSEISYMGSIAYGNGKFVALMQVEGGTWPIPPALKMLYSADGINWTVKDTALRSIIGLTFSNGRFFAYGGELSSSLATSTDGENWTVVANTQGEITGPVYGDGKWVFVTRYYSGVGGRIMYSTDGVTWTAAKIPSGFDFRAIAYGSDKFIAMDHDGKMAYSTDGVIWTVAPGTHGNGVRSIAYGAGKFVKLGWDHSSYSEDGLTWTFIDFFGLGGDPAIKIVYGGGKFVAVSWEGKMAYSTDGITWAAVDISVFGGSNLRYIAYGNGRFVVLDAYGGIGGSPATRGRIAYSNMQE
jgi:hypothetical protein